MENIFKNEKIFLVSKPILYIFKRFLFKNGVLDAYLNEIENADTEWRERFWPLSKSRYLLIDAFEWPSDDNRWEQLNKKWQLLDIDLGKSKMHKVYTIFKSHGII